MGKEMNGIVDFHSHILPGIDDGSASVLESITMLKMEAEQGVRHVIATPHFYAQHDTPQRFLAKRKVAEEKLREEMEKHSNLPELHVGAEVYFFSGMQHSDLLSGLTIDEKKCILIEMPNPQWTPAMYRELEGVWSRQGLTPILAHVDRYIRPFHTYHIPEQLERLPVLVQANASFFLQKQTRRMALKMLKKDRIHLIGSDCHNVTTRVPNLGEAVGLIKGHFGSGALDKIRYYQDMALNNLEVD